MPNPSNPFIALPIGPDTVKVLGETWKADAPWAGLDFSRATLLHESILGEDYHLRVPWCHPADQPHGWADGMFYRVRPRRKGWRFQMRDGQWWVVPPRAGATDA